MATTALSDKPVGSGTPRPVGAPAKRVAPRLNVTQMVRQAARLAEVRPELVAAYQVALRRWSGDPMLRLLGLPIVTEGYRSPERQDELYTR